MTFLFDAAHVAIRTLDICAGTVLLGEGLRAGLRHLGAATRTICYIEREAYAATPLDRHRQHRLRAIGNGVVALQAATAFVSLFQRMK